MRGLFVTFEGGEGSGKTTQLGLLAVRLRAAGERVVETRDPGGTAIGKEIRAILLSRESGPISAATELFLYEASRAQLVRDVIAPALERGTIVLCDRFTDSTLAYQGFGRGLDVEVIRRMDRLATGGLGPDLTMLLDLEPAMGLARCRRDAASDVAPRDRIEAEPLDFHRRVREGYRRLAREEPDRFRVMDARLPVREIEAAVWDEFLRLRRARLGGASRSVDG
jgi:dTMP kinase